MRKIIKKFLLFFFLFCVMENNQRELYPLYYSLCRYLSSRDVFVCHKGLFILSFMTCSLLGGASLCQRRCNFLNTRCAAGICFSCNRISYASLTLLVRADPIYEIIVVCSELGGAVITHPSTSCSRGNGELNTLVRNGADTIISLCDSESKKGENIMDESHFIYMEIMLYMDFRKEN
jgi:hypothetical protein